MAYAQSVQTSCQRVGESGGSSAGSGLSTWQGYVKGVVDALNLPETVTAKAKRAYSSTTALQYDLGATPDKARASFGSTAEAMAEVFRAILQDDATTWAR